jgi:hypothetical protein
MAEQRTALDAESKKLTREIDTLYQHLVSGLVGIKDQISRREDRLKVITNDLAKLDGLAQVVNLNLRGIEKLIRRRSNGGRTAWLGALSSRVKSSESSLPSGSSWCRASRAPNGKARTSIRGRWWQVMASF